MSGSGAEQVVTSRAAGRLSFAVGLLAIAPIACGSSGATTTSASGPSSTASHASSSISSTGAGGAEASSSSTVGGAQVSSQVGSSSSSVTGTGGASSSSASTGGASSSASTGGAGGGGAVCTPPSGGTPENQRGGGADVLPLSGYDYAPSVIVTAANTYQMWWCGLNAAAGGGDEIRYAEASSLDGPWHSHASATPNTFDVAMTAGGNGTQFFDTTDACDPSVVQAPDGTYLLYYGGNGAPWAGAPNNTTQIGVAQSPTGLPGTWTKLNGEKPIVTPYQNLGAASYGAGQPSVVLVSDFFYMIYTDTTGADGYGMYVLRTPSSDPTFQSSQVETFDGSGFVPLSSASLTSHKVTGSVDGDWFYADAVDAFVFAADDTFDAMQLTVWSPVDFSVLGTAEITTGGNADGPGIVHTASGHAPPSATCGVLPVDLMRADCYLTAGDTTDCNMDPYGGTNGSNVSLWDLAHVGVDLPLNEACACVHAASVTWPWVDIDAPAPGATVSGTVLVGGWTLDNIDAVGPAIDGTSIQVLVDGTLAGLATYGGSRPDVCMVYPGRVGCPNVGYNYLLDVSALAPGPHTITIVAGDTEPLSERGTASVVVNR